MAYPTIGNMPNQYYQPSAQMYPSIQQPQLYNNYIPQQQQLQPRPSLSGRIVTDPNEIAPQEVIMDSGVSLFPMQDYSCIYAKQVSPNGTIATVKYVPEVIPQDDPNAQSIDVSASLGDIFNQLTDIKDLLKKNNYKKPYQKRHPVATNNSEENANA